MASGLPDFDPAVSAGGGEAEKPEPVGGTGAARRGGEAGLAEGEKSDFLKLSSVEPREGDGEVGEKGLGGAAREGAGGEGEGGRAESLMPRREVSWSVPPCSISTCCRALGRGGGEENGRAGGLGDGKRRRDVVSREGR